MEWITSVRRSANWSAVNVAASSSSAPAHPAAATKATTIIHGLPQKFGMTTSCRAPSHPFTAQVLSERIDAHLWNWKRDPDHDKSVRQSIWIPTLQGLASNRLR